MGHGPHDGRARDGRGRAGGAPGGGPTGTRDRWARRGRARPRGRGRRCRCRCRARCRYGCARSRAAAVRAAAAAAVAVAPGAAIAAAASRPVTRCDRPGEPLGTQGDDVVPGPDRIREQHGLLALVVHPPGHQQDRIVRPGGHRLLEHLGEDDHLERPLEILDGGHGHRRLGLRDHAPERGDHAADHDALLVELLAHVAGVRVGVLAHVRGKLAQRMVREVQADELLLPAQPLPGGGGRGVRQRPLQDDLIDAQAVEQGDLAGHAVALLGLAVRRWHRRARAAAARGGRARSARRP